VRQVIAVEPSAAFATRLSSWDVIFCHRKLVESLSRRWCVRASDAAVLITTLSLLLPAAHVTLGVEIFSRIALAVSNDTSRFHIVFTPGCGNIVSHAYVPVHERPVHHGWEPGAFTLGISKEVARSVTSIIVPLAAAILVTLSTPALALIL